MDPTIPPPPAPAGKLSGPQVTGLSCPSCGGTLDVSPGTRVLTCPFCTTPLLALGYAGLARYAVRPKMSAEQAEGVVRKWWSKGWDKHPALGREAATAEAFLCFLPFFRAEADAMGYAFGVEQRTRTTGSGKNRRTETYEVDVEKQVERHFDETSAAVNVAEWGVAKVNLTGDELTAFDTEQLERLGMVVPPTGSEIAARRESTASFREQADPGRGLKRVYFRFLELIRERFSVIYYPLWVVRYRFRERSYQALVDAEDGSLAYAKAPGNDLYRALMGVGSQAAACFIATTALQWAAKGDVDNPLALIVGAGAAALFVLAWGFKRFRYGGVVEEGTGYVPREQGGWLGKLLSLNKKGG